MRKNLQKAAMANSGKPVWIIQMTKPPKAGQNN